MFDQQDSNVPRSASIISVMRWPSSGPAPAMGSSSSNRLGDVASASASSSMRRSPCAKSPTGRCARSNQPNPIKNGTSPFMRSDRKRPAAKTESFVQAAPASAIMPFSRTVKSINTLLIWNDRPMPAELARLLTGRLGHDHLEIPDPNRVLTRRKFAGSRWFFQHHSARSAHEFHQASRVSERLLVAVKAPKDLLQAAKI